MNRNQVGYMMSPWKPVNKPYILSSVFKLAVLNIKISSCMRICNLSLSKIDSNSTPPPPKSAIKPVFPRNPDHFIYIHIVVVVPTAFYEPTFHPCHTFFFLSSSIVLLLASFYFPRGLLYVFDVGNCPSFLWLQRK